jgi:hypothetical protein
MTRIHQIFPEEFPEAWASDWGEDEYGIFMGFTYKGVRQDFRVLTTPLRDPTPPQLI